jgi:hypothetical protein
MPILTYCNQNGSCPAPLYNAMDEGASGQSYIQDISTMPTCENPCPCHCLSVFGGMRQPSLECIVWAAITAQARQ